MRRLLIIFFLLFVILVNLFAQTNLPDGFNRFYYPNGNLSSEGVITDSKPNGFWRNYYENGTIKSEGNRLNFLLDSTWTFYFPDGNINTEINYREDKKNGYTITYDIHLAKDSSKIHYLKSKELYYLGKKEGLAYYFDKNNKLQSTINFQNDKRHGYGKIYNQDSVVIIISTYFNGFQTDIEKINRKDENNKMQGKWIDFYPNGNKHIEKNYLDNKLHGIYKEYDVAENLISELRYEYGEIVVAKEETQKITLKAQTKSDYYTNGNLKYEGAFINNIPVGIHKEYSETGKILISKEYSPTGKILGEGLFDNNGLKTGKWRLYDTIYNYFYAEGFFEKGLKEGQWKFFFPDNSLEQEGFFSSDNPDREWFWYYPNGSKKTEEVYMNGKLEGHFKEYDKDGKTIAEGEYFDNDKVGEWKYNIGTVSQTGKYEYSEKNDDWKMYYVETEKKYFSGSFRNGDAIGKHYWYYPDGSIMIAGEYRANKKHNNWKKYNLDGTIETEYTYKNGELTKIDGVKIKSLENKR
ncbi:MAG: hypothetical protein LBV69_11415 [Bacteroidales bacterium]|jgi:antitoxin component YwqK of YwqJK toxin-antitoxin module|nr:hypothetical protein [Bacteroidales bacterium]